MKGCHVKSGGRGWGEGAAGERRDAMQTRISKFSGPIEHGVSTLSFLIF